MKKTLTLLTILMLLVFMVGCENSINPIKSDNLTVNEAYGAPEVYRILAKHAITSEAKLGDLIAGQNEIVGGVYISYRASDGMYPAENLKIVLGMSGETEYYLSESHVMVTTKEDAEGNPIWPDGTVNKAGNPSPGKFPYYSEMPATTPGYNFFHHWPHTGYGPGNDAHVYHIPWENDWDANTYIYIAVHAKVAKEVPVYGEVVVPYYWKTVWQIGLEEEHSCDGNLTNYADEFNYPEAGPCALGTGLWKLKPPYANPFIVGTTDIEKFPHKSSFYPLYAPNFDVQWDGELLNGGRLTISWSPGATAFEVEEISGDGLSSTQIISAQGTPISGEGWFMDTYPLFKPTMDIDVLAFGTHTFNFMVSSGDGFFWDYVLLEEPCTEIGIVGTKIVYESVWAYGDFFTDKNWSMNFVWSWTGSFGENVHI